MHEILTITLNPAVDLATSVERVIAGPKLYCKSPKIDPGGGGVNVARAICKLGGSAKALVALGGASGEQLRRLLWAEGVPVHSVSVSGETRQSIAVSDETDGAQYRFSLPGETLTQEDSDRLMAAIVSNTPPDGYVVLSGGVAPGLGDAYPDKIRAALAPLTDKLVVDTSKGALTQLMAHPKGPVFLLRLDQHEADIAAGHPLENVAQSVAFAKAQIARGVTQCMILGRQAEGSILVTIDACYICRTPQVPVVSKIGAGDAFTGAVTLSLSKGDPFDLALRWGVAAASATMGTEGTGLCDIEVVKSLLPQCQVEQI